MENKTIMAAMLISFGLMACQSTIKKTSDSLNAHIDTSQAVADGQLTTTDASNTAISELPEHVVADHLKEMYANDLNQNLIDSSSRKFAMDKYDLDADGNMEVFVALTGPYFCGSGGCTLLLLNNNGKLIDKFTVSGTPVMIGNEKTNGWSNLLIESGGKYHLLKYDGKAYPSNPSLAPVVTKPDMALKKVLAGPANHTF
ncbi:hypothetical protein [Chitinophaga sp. Cy-1792]|uniref:hypothetical protein n=1 Tax=Chitinophaga sp. Cy-1792 TaxID=2608339 RepID=UPI00142106FE|nr:hypothetical protein [Chitinophaga sp. Cy-1792]NIG57546.1 hypothetical protein [Chitinophaga sp. Cy-1792]